MSRAFRNVAFLSLVGAAAVTSACGWDPSRPFEREAPEVREAIGYLDGGDAHVATDLLTAYLETGACKEGSIGAPARLHDRPQATFDLGLALFAVAESFGGRFGDEDRDGIPAQKTEGSSDRENRIACALRIAAAVSEDNGQPIHVRARAAYLEGNLHFLAKNYKEAVLAYDRALELAPGMSDAGPERAAPIDAGAWDVDPVGRDAAWNRAIAQKRIEDQKDAGQDGGDQGDGGKEQGDGGNDKGDGGNDQGDGGQTPPDGGGDDQPKDDGGQPPPDEGPDAGRPPPREPEEAGAPPPPSRTSQDERLLDQLEAAPTVQQNEAARRAQKRVRVRGAADK